MINYRTGSPPTTEIPLHGQGRWLSIQEDGGSTVLSISGPRGGELASVTLAPDLAELVASALLRKNLGPSALQLKEVISPKQVLVYAAAIRAPGAPYPVSVTR